MSNSMSVLSRSAGGSGARGLPISDILRSGAMVASDAGNIVSRLFAADTVKEKGGRGLSVEYIVWKKGGEGERES